MLKVDEKVKIFISGVKLKANNHFEQGDFENPWKFNLLHDSFGIRKAAALIWEEAKILYLSNKVRICPCCGQLTEGDIDY